MAEQNEEGKKTIVSFIVGLLIGGLLVWSFSGTNGTTTTETDNDSAPTNGAEMEEGDEAATDTTNSTDTEVTETTTETTSTNNPPALPTGEGSVTIADTTAGSRIPMESATFPVSEGWVGVRDYNNGKLGAILGVVRFSEAQGLVPTDIILQRATVAGNEYAIVFYTEDSDREFNVATDVQIEGVITTFSAT